MKFSVGLQYENDRFIDEIIAEKAYVDEVYFSWGDFRSGRGRTTEHGTLLPWELMQKQEEILDRLSKEGLSFNLLYNAECYGEDSLARSFFEKIGDTTEYEGIPSQTIPAAILSCKGTMMAIRLVDAAKRARELGLIRSEDEAALLEDLNGSD